MNTFLTFKWTVSRGRDTYGYNICTVTDTRRNTKHRCNGGGYDMQGTSFANWLMATYPERLVEINARAYNVWDGENYTDKHGELYGMTFYSHKNSVNLDGAAGLSSMLKIAEAIGLKIQSNYSRRGGLEGMYVEDTKSE